MDAVKPAKITPLWNGKWAVHCGESRWEVSSVAEGVQLLKDRTDAPAIVVFDKAGKAVASHTVRLASSTGERDDREPARPAGSERAGNPALIPAHVRAQYRQADRIAEALSHHVWPTLGALLGPPFVAALVAPTVAAADSFPALFGATLAWSLGMATCTVLFASGAWERMHPFASWLAIGATFAASSAVATALALGALDNPQVCVRACDWRTAPLVYAAEAIDTFRPLGFLLGTTAGIVAGTWAWSIARKWLQSQSAIGMQLVQKGPATQRCPSRPGPWTRRSLLCHSTVNA